MLFEEGQGALPGILGGFFTVVGLTVVEEGMGSLRVNSNLVLLVIVL
jgi:hypothetical protein